MKIHRMLTSFILSFLFCTAALAQMCPLPESITYINRGWHLTSDPITKGWVIVKSPMTNIQEKLNFHHAIWRGTYVGVMSCVYKSKTGKEVILMQKTYLPQSRYWVTTGAVRIPQEKPLPHYICAAPAASECY